MIGMKPMSHTLMFMCCLGLLGSGHNSSGNREPISGQGGGSSEEGGNGLQAEGGRSGVGGGASALRVAVRHPFIATTV